MLMLYCHKCQKGVKMGVLTHFEGKKSSHRPRAIFHIQPGAACWHALEFKVKERCNATIKKTGHEVRSASKLAKCGMRLQKFWCTHF
jgi:hypothetical protein